MRFKRKFICKLFSCLAASLLVCNTLTGATTIKTFKNSCSDPLLQDTTDATEKVVYLTFDDGPSKNTEKVLNILSNEGVKATFFVVGPIIAEDVQYMKRAHDEGHAIGNHTYDHDYKYVYLNEDVFWKNYNKAQDYIYQVTGAESKIFRFPGGSKSSIVRNEHGKEFSKNLGKNLNEKGVEYFDWNIDSGDGMTDYTSASTLYNNIIKEMKLLQNKSKVIVLMHDSKGKNSTVEALPSIIKYFKDNGYTFKPLESKL